MRIRKIAPGEAPPMVLLLLADPSEETVVSYLDTAECFIAEADDAVVGTYVTGEISEDRAEVFNIAVAEAWQGRGIGRMLLQDAIDRHRAKGCLELHIGTGNSSIGQLALYQKCGFRIDGVIKDFFTDNYEGKIHENGIWCRDMIRLVKVL
ncbi:GNAT family N-acetyltransferase [Salinicoccus roseus]|uniref:GNAT family N-acetyltransferase n=1 Tax=Salinicoccus roseus TaxID=45670 RepID=UPI0023019F24|nr:GNAT family N-acetyltransferase [Salinicoccus roseus]